MARPDSCDALAEKILAAVRNELVFNFVTQRGSQAALLEAIARVLREEGGLK